VQSVLPAVRRQSGGNRESGKVAGGNFWHSRWVPGFRYALPYLPRYLGKVGRKCLSSLRCRWLGGEVKFRWRDEVTRRRGFHGRKSRRPN